MSSIVKPVLVVVQPLIDLECEYSTLEGPIDFAQHCSIVKAIRDASVEASKKLNEFTVELSMRKDIFDRVSAFRDKADLSKLTGEQRRFVEKEIVYGKRNGLHLPEEIRAQITDVKKRISELGTNYMANMNEDVSFLEFSREELAGVPEDLVNSFQEVSAALDCTPLFIVVRRTKG